MILKHYKHTKTPGKNNLKNFFKLISYTNLFLINNMITTEGRLFFTISLHCTNENMCFRAKKKKKLAHIKNTKEKYIIDLLSLVIFIYHHCTFFSSKQKETFCLLPIVKIKKRNPSNLN